MDYVFVFYTKCSFMHVVHYELCDSHKVFLRYVIFYYFFTISTVTTIHYKIITLQQFKTHEHNLIKRRDYTNAYSIRATN